MKDKEFELLHEPEVQSGCWKNQSPRLFENDFGIVPLKYLRPSKPLFIPQKNEPHIKN